MRWEQAKGMEKEIGRKRHRAREEKEGRRWEGKGTWRREKGERKGR